MLICPQCQFENPNTNKFCQSCGTSLTQKACSKCGTNVALNVERCPNCHAQTGVVWWAIISPDYRQELGTGDSSCLLGQRYQLLEPLPALQEEQQVEIQVRVLDCQPLQLSPLEAASSLEMPIPGIAKTYLQLQPQLHQVVPKIHDAWQQGEQQVLLIADRSDWLKLVDLWQDEKTTLLEILQWMYEVSGLWTALEPWHCRQSLLELTNLRVDEKGVLALQRLYAEAEKSLTVQDLGRVWQRLSQESGRTQFGALLQLLADIQTCSIPTIDDLRSRLEAIMTELKANVTSTPDLPLEAAGELEATPTVLKMDEEEVLVDSDMPTVVMPVQLVSLEDAGRTDVGQQRDHNEDFFGIETTLRKAVSPTSEVIEARGLYILCDGMGGHAGGDVASALAVRTLQQYFQSSWQQQLPTEETIREAVRLANQAIYDLNQKDARSGVGRMGTTLVLVLLQGTQVAVAHVGDSRAYRLTAAGLQQLTVDHEVGQREIARGIEAEIAYARADAYQLTQALGPRDENFVHPDVQFLQLSEDTLLLLVSDGFSDNHLVEDFWQTHLKPLLNSETDLRRGVGDLIDLANKYNGHDNITAIAIRAKVQPNQGSREEAGGQGKG